MTGEAPAGRFVVLGAGPAGLWAALELARSGRSVVVLERAAAVGGNAGSFEIRGQRVDYGSHRLHAATDPEILAELQQLLGRDLLHRPRRGRIRLGGRWLDFPLRPLDLMLRLPPAFSFGVGLDLFRRGLGRRHDAGEDSFATVLEAGLGRTICRRFYFPYARKIWGLEPEEIAPEQARRRVSAGSVGRILKRLLTPSSAAGKRHFYYPRQGFGQICERVAEAATEAGAEIRLGVEVERVRRLADGSWQVDGKTSSGPIQVPGSNVWATIPLTHTARMARPTAPVEVLEAAAALRSRAMVLAYLVLEVDRFSAYDAHYFPDPATPFTRVSEPKVYADRATPAGQTILCAEIPCWRDDPVWSEDEDTVGARVAAGLVAAGLPLPVAPREVRVRRLPQAYPVYDRGYEDSFERIESWLRDESGILSFGRQGLFAHDNTHHAMYMARAAVDSLGDGDRLDPDRWAAYREIFRRHVVED